ncbi:hypothetical protein B0T19DRAFT_188818 [Cercophora scortea]|uniref:Uncharacterized protein n=1 Tax=Cercophora scortea TaxID=314031 RepID=A0AAE0ME42_9PEZI|nr:hypothetical protein B0T19DRAFT_188818 [Cercophora scortea]
MLFQPALQCDQSDEQAWLVKEDVWLMAQHSTQRPVISGPCSLSLGCNTRLETFTSPSNQRVSPRTHELRPNHETPPTMRVGQRHGPPCDRHEGSDIFPVPMGAVGDGINELQPGIVWEPRLSDQDKSSLTTYSDHQRNCDLLYKIAGTGVSSSQTRSERGCEWTPVKKGGFGKAQPTSASQGITILYVPSPSMRNRRPLRLFSALGFFEC